MRVKGFFISTVIIYTLGISTSFGVDAVEISAGKASENIDVLRIALHASWSSRWLETSTGELTGYHAFSINHWQGGEDSIQAVAYSPVFAYRFRDAFVSYLKFGIGAAYISDKQIEGRNLSSHFQFEDQLGIGWEWGAHDLALTYMHYSNAGVQDPNEGIDMVLLSYALNFQ